MFILNSNSCKILNVHAMTTDGIWYQWKMEMSLNVMNVSQEIRHSIENYLDEHKVGVGIYQYTNLIIRTYFLTEICFTYKFLWEDCSTLTAITVVLCIPSTLLQTKGHIIKAPLTHRQIHVTHPSVLGKFVNYGEFWTKVIENLLYNFKNNER